MKEPMYAQHHRIHPTAYRALANADSPLPPRGGWRPLRIGEMFPAKVKVVPGAQLEAEELSNEIAQDLRMEAEHA